MYVFKFDSFFFTLFCSIMEKFQWNSFQQMFANILYSLVFLYVLLNKNFPYINVVCLWNRCQFSLLHKCDDPGLFFFSVAFLFNLIKLKYMHKYISSEIERKWEFVWEKFIVTVMSLLNYWLNNVEQRTNPFSLRLSHSTVIHFFLLENALSKVLFTKERLPFSQLYHKHQTYLVAWKIISRVRLSIISW